MTPVREATHADVARIVSIHLAAFPGFFLTSVGPRFLTELYVGFLHDASGILLVAEIDRNLSGFVAGTTMPEGFFRRLLRRRGAAFVAASVFALARAPVLVGSKLLRGITYRGECPSTLTDAALLSSVAVRPESAGKGIGRSLVEQFCREAETRGARYVYLTTDRDENAVTNRFYESCRFVLETTIRRDRDRWMNRYVRTLP